VRRSPSRFGYGDAGKLEPTITEEEEEEEEEEEKE
jgi:hypothetical protein